MLFIFNYMVEYSDEETLSLILKAVSDGTRRSLLTQLCQQGPTRVTDLANYYDVSLNAISKHIKVLEAAGLVRRHARGRTHWIEADLAQTGVMQDWLASLQSIWALRLEKLDTILKDGEKPWPT